MGTYTFTHVKDGVLGKADDMLNPVGEDFELLERIPRKLPFRYGSHRGPQFTEKHEDVAVGENGYGPALQDWLRDERVKLDYER